MKHWERMTWTASQFPPPPGTAAYAELMKRVEATAGNEAIQQRVKALWRTARATAVAVQANGAGHEVDQTLRYFMTDVCNRLWKMGPWGSMPSSFNVTSDFLAYNQKYSLFTLLDEVDHEFSAAHFLDFVTSPSSGLDPIENALQLPEAKIHSFTNLDSPSELSVGDASSREFVVAGCSMVRHGSELSMCLVAGQSVDFADHKRADLAEQGGYRKKGLEKLGKDPAGIVNLRGDDRLQKVVALMRIDLRNRTRQVRYALEDYGDSFSVATDDPSIWSAEALESLGSDFKSKLKTLDEQLKPFGSLFEFMSHCLLLPHFFDRFADTVQARRTKTDFGNRRSSTRFTREIEAALADAKLSYRVIARLFPLDSYRVPSTMVAPELDLKIERSGFWRTLSPSQTGTDRNGKQVLGKTWVSKELTWREGVEASTGLHATTQKDERHGLDPGFIYVMRNAAHPLDVFKVGLTRRDADVRANELSAATGVPDKFLVVQHWSVGDCTTAERLIHEALDRWRLADDREFFRADYRHIREVIDRVLSALNGSVAHS